MGEIIYLLGTNQDMDGPQEEKEEKREEEPTFIPAEQ